MNLSVVVPARHAAFTVGHQLDALRAQEYEGDWEVVVVNDGSDPQTSASLSRYASWPRLRVVSTPVSRGPGHARNQGILAARAHLIACCDADDEVSPGWLSAMGGGLARYDYVTGPLEVHKLNAPAVAASRGGWIEAHVPPVFAGIVPFAHSCNLGIHRRTWALLGGFDERLRSGEDVDLGIKAIRSGVQLGFDDAASVHYRYRSGLSELFRQSRAHAAAWPTLCKRLRAAGLGSPGRLEGLRRDAWLVWHIASLVNPERRVRWVWVAGQGLGRVEGSLRELSVFV